MNEDLSLLSLEELIARQKAVSETRDQIERTKRERRKAFEAALDAEFAAADEEARKAFWQLENAKDAIKVKTASHTHEGKLVEFEKEVWSSGWRATKTTKKLRGIVKVLRSHEDRPPVPKRARYEGNAITFGEAFIQRINAKGEPLTEFYRLYEETERLPRGWKVVEENVA